MKLSIIGLGYVGLPLFKAFTEVDSVDVVGFDLDSRKISDLVAGEGYAKEILGCSWGVKKSQVSNCPKILLDTDIFIIAVPTPVDGDNIPNLDFINGAVEVIHSYLRSECIVVLESTVYPGVTKEYLWPKLAEKSGLEQGSFAVGYSPERINPGDAVNKLKNTAKLVSASSPDALAKLISVYGSVCDEVVPVSKIEIAEASKLVENIQRDVNIALMNELSQAFSADKLNFQDILAAADTKWNFVRYEPGLVGGHCIGVDPYYFLQYVNDRGFISNMVSTARKVNEAKVVRVTEDLIELCDQLYVSRKNKKKVKVLCLGATFKPNVPDFRNSKNLDVVLGLSASTKVSVALFDPYLKDAVGLKVKTIQSIEQFTKYDFIVILVSHRTIFDLGENLLRSLLPEGTGIIDVSGSISFADKYIQ